MGQHRPAIPTIYQLIRKKSQTPSAENQHAPLLNQGNWHLIAILWDGCGKNGELMSFTTNVKNLQSGTYLFDLFEREGMVADARSDIGYAVMTRKIVISGKNELVLHLDGQLETRTE